MKMLSNFLEILIANWITIKIIIVIRKGTIMSVALFLIFIYKKKQFIYNILESEHSKSSIREDMFEAEFCATKVLPACRVSCPSASLYSNQRTNR